jgi:hypothetical protein
MIEVDPDRFEEIASDAPSRDSMVDKAGSPGKMSRISDSGDLLTLVRSDR